ncbi:MAG: hypothetical protein WCE23_00560 [Candidatus Binatus sp.]|uniref:hypothetical protein n=1 Tax=Candidatus Binatus sp. TaxID=2811406 RepID=UPI003C72E16A
MSTRTVIHTVGLFLALLVAPTAVFGEEFSRVSVPLPVEIDGRPMRCPLYLKFEMKSYNIPFNQFAAGPLDKEQTMFVTVVQAIRKADAAKFRSVWTSPDQMKGLGTTVISLADDSPENWIRQARSIFDFDNLKVIAQIQLGLRTMFIWDSMTKDGARRNAFYVGFDKNNQLRLSAVSSSIPVASMVLNAFRAAQTEPDAYKPLPNINLRYEYPIPLDGEAAPSAHPVFLEFDGSPMDFPLGDEKVKPPTALLEFFRKATFAHQQGKDDLYASSFTPKSAEKVRQWLASMKSRRRLANQPPQMPSTLGNVKFVLNAEPIFLVFEAPAAGNDWKPENLTYSYILHKGGGYKIANYFYSSDLDDFLQNPSFFDKGVLKSAPTTPPSK